MIHRLTALELATLAALIAVLSLSVASEDWLIAGLALAFTATATIAVYAHSVVLRYKNECRAARSPGPEFVGSAGRIEARSLPVDFDRAGGYFYCDCLFMDGGERPIDLS